MNDKIMEYIALLHMVKVFRERTYEKGLGSEPLGIEFDNLKLDIYQKIGKEIVSNMEKEKPIG